MGGREGGGEGGERQGGKLKWQTAVAEQRAGLDGGMIMLGSGGVLV